MDGVHYVKRLVGLMITFCTASTMFCSAVQASLPNKKVDNLSDEDCESCETFKGVR